MFERLEEHLDNVPTHAERGFEFEFEGVTFRGKIDAIFVMPQGVRIVDYKTGRYPIALYEVEENLQLGIYLLALLRDPDLQALGNPYKVELIYLGGDQKALTTRPFTPTREHVPKVEARLRDMLTLIRQERFAPNPEANCHFCNFKSICPLWAEGAEVQT